MFKYLDGPYPRIQNVLKTFGPNSVVGAQHFKTALLTADYHPTVLDAELGLAQIVALPQVELVMAAIVGAAGLPSTVGRTAGCTPPCRRRTG